jgi:lysozyme family protein
MYSPAFEKAISRVLGHEGEYSNNPLDPGRETIWGITSRTARKNGYTGEMRYMAREFAVGIYHSEYWLPVRGDDLPFCLSFLLFDGAVNSGPPQSIIWLQRTLGVEDDGIFGPKTLAAVRSSNPAQFLRLISERGEFQTSLPTWPAFGKGWSRRNYLNLSFFSLDLLEDYEIRPRNAGSGQNLQIPHETEMGPSEPPDPENA